MKKIAIGFIAGFCIMGIMGFTPSGGKKSSKKGNQQEIDILREKVNRLDDRVTALEIGGSKKKKKRSGFRSN